MEASHQRVEAKEGRRPHHTQPVGMERVRGTVGRDGRYMALYFEFMGYKSLLAFFFTASGFSRLDIYYLLLLKTCRFEPLSCCLLDGGTGCGCMCGCAIDTDETELVNLDLRWSRCTRDWVRRPSLLNCSPDHRHAVRPQSGRKRGIKCKLLSNRRPDRVMFGARRSWPS